MEVVMRKIGGGVRVRGGEREGRIVGEGNDYL